MAGIAQLCFSLVLLHFIALSNAQEGPSLPNSVVLPVTRDVSTNLFVTQVYMGNVNEPLAPMNLVIDLAGSCSWVASSSLSHQPISSCSLQCSKAKASSCTWPSSTGNKTAACTLQTENPITKMVKRGELTENIIFVPVSDRVKTGSLALLPRFLISSVPALLLSGLGNDVKGILGLGNSRISLPTQVAETFGFQRKFFLCLSSSNGVVHLGESTHLSLLDCKAARSLMYTPLFHSDGYYIKVKSIRINDKKLIIKEALLIGNQGHVGGTKISTTVPYSTMESTLYRRFTEAYIRAAVAMNMTIVSPVAPFGVCFSSGGMEMDKKRLGPDMLTIDLVLQSEMVKWRIHGRNSMIHVSDKVMCLGFLDGGLSSKASIVLGSNLLEDKLLEFNLATSMLGFSSSLSNMERRSCSSSLGEEVQSG